MSLDKPGFGIKSGWKDAYGHVWENDYNKIMERDRDRYGKTSEPKSRSALNRMFDMLQVGQYTIQGGIAGAIDPNDDLSVGKGMAEGFKAGNPFGDGNEKGEYYFSDNLAKMGWNPESTGGKIAKGVVGFAGDVLLDPLTYINPVSIGGSAVFKGTGTKVGKEVVEKFTPAMAEKILKQTTKTIPDVKDVEDLVRRINKSRGIVESGSGRGFGIYGDNIPFASKLGLAGKKAELISEASLRAFGDATIAPYINKIGDSLVHSKAGKLFSNKADLLDMARRDPQGLAMGFEFARKAGKANLTYKDALKELKDDYSKLTALEPESRKLITKMLEDTSLWEKMTTYKPLKESAVGANLYAHIEDFVKKYGMEDKNMQKVMSEIIPKFKSGEKVTMRFPGMKDTDVFIEGMTGTANGVKHYKIKGYDKNIPETAFLNPDEIAKERITASMVNVKASVDAGDTGRINISNDVLNPSTELDDAITNGIIPVKRGRTKGSKNKVNPYKDYVPSEAEMAERLPYVDNFGNKVADYEERWMAQNDITKSMKDEVAVTKETVQAEPKFNQVVEDANASARSKVVGDATSDELYVNGSLNTSSRRIIRDEKGQIKTIMGAEFKDGRWVEKKGKAIIQSQSSIKYANLKNGGSHQDFKRFITDKIRIDDNGRVMNGDIQVGSTTAKGVSDKTTLANLTGIKGLNKKAWNAIAGNEAQEASFFERLLMEEPAVKEMFSGLMETGTMTMKKNNIRNFMDAYFNKSYYKPADMVHAFHNNHDVITKMLEEEFGKYSTVKAMGDKARELKKTKTKWDGEGVRPDANIERARMTRQYEIMNNPDAIARAEKAQRALTDERAYDGIGGIRNDVAEADARMSADKSKDKSTLDYINADNNIQALSDQNVTHQVWKDGKPVAKVTEVGDGVHVWYKGLDKEGMPMEVQIDKANLHKQGYRWSEAKVSTSVTGTKLPTKKVSDVVDNSKLETEYQERLADSRADVFKSKDTKSVNMSNKTPDDNPMGFTKVKTEVVNGRIINSETGEIIDDVINVAKPTVKVDGKTVSKTGDVDFDNVINRWDGKDSISQREMDNMIAQNSSASEMQSAIKEVEAKWIIKDEQNLALISETITHMDGKEVQGAYKTVEQALSELPSDIKRIITQGKIDEANALKLQEKLTTYRQALTTQVEFERFARTLWGDTKVDRILTEHATVTRAIDTFELADRDIVKIAEGVRKDFKSVAQMEKAIGQLDNVVLEGYVAHVVNPMFKSPLAQFTQEELDNMGIKIPKNQFEISRTYTKGTVMLDGHTLTEGTVEEINEHILKFGEEINKKLISFGYEPKKLEKLFQDEISDIYLARMQNHYKLMYDDSVFGDITMKFGKKYEGVIDEDYSLTVSTQSLRKAFKRMAPDTKAKYLESYGLTQDQFNKLGNSFIRVDKNVADKITKDGFAEIHQVGNVVLDKAERLAHVQIAEDTHGLLGAYDKFLRTYKLMVTAYRPAFHFNNMKGNAFNNYLDVGSKALSPKYNLAGIDMAMGKNLDKVINLGGKDYTYKQIVDELSIQGKIGNGFFGTDIKKVLAKELEEKVTDTPLKKAFKFPTDMASRIEDQGKLVNFMANLDLGKSMNEAGEHVDKFLFDYGDLTKFEQETMKRIFPFYTWMRKNAPLQLEQMLTNPKRYAPVAKVIGEMENMTDDNKRIDKNKVPAFAKDWIQLPFNIMGDNGNMEALMWSNNLPYMDINKIPNILSPKDSMTNLFESSSPAIRMPVELGTNYNYFFDREIDKGAKVVDPSGKFEVSPQLAYVLSQIPQYAEPAGMVKKEGIDKLIHFFDKGMASGIKSYDNAGYGGTVGGGSSYQEQTIVPQTQDIVPKKYAVGKYPDNGISEDPLMSVSQQEDMYSKSWQK